MKYIELNEHFKVTIGQEYISSAYPETGMYHSSACGYVLVNKEQGTVFPIGTTLFFNQSQELTATGQNLSESFVLKVLAIAQNPELAKELTQ